RRPGRGRRGRGRPRARPPLVAALPGPPQRRDHHGRLAGAPRRPAGLRRSRLDHGFHGPPGADAGAAAARARPLRHPTDPRRPRRARPHGHRAARHGPHVLTHRTGNDAEPRLRKENP
ncbi:hypothetical protein HMPREF9005_1363, partial [Actinomyces sp. oral taxon 178 str. F0338]